MLILWHVTVSEDHDIDDINGECDSKDTLSDVEILIENFENEHASTMACSRQRKYARRVQHCFGFAHGGGEFAVVAQRFGARKS